VPEDALDKVLDMSDEKAAGELAAQIVDRGGDLT
jgi:hypothetical protein